MRTIEREIQHEDYMRVMKTQRSQVNKYVKLQSREHVIYTLSARKTSLSTFDNKRFWLMDNQSSLPLGHYEIDNYLPAKHKQTVITDFFGACAQDPPDQTNLKLQQIVLAASLRVRAPTAAAVAAVAVAAATVMIHSQKISKGKDQVN